MNFRATCAIAALLAFAGHSTQAAEFRLAHQFAPDSLPGQSAQHFADLVAEKTGGASSVTVLPGGALGDERANLQQVGSESIDFALTGDLVISFMAQPYMLVSMPFIFKSPEHSMAVFNGEIGGEINAYLEETHGIESLGWQYVGTRMLTANKPVRNLADLQGLKTRLPGAQMWITTWKKTGVDAASIAFTELYLALQTGTVSAEENPPNFVRTQKYYEVQDYIMTTDHVPQMQSFFANHARMAALDEATRKAVTEAAAETVAWTSKTALAGHKADLDWLTGEGGMELVEFDPTGIPELIAGVPEEVLGQDGIALYKRITETPF
ncbi:tripartite ATP-independent transporter DctP family solute receptor [Hoeflea marina]|uniref:Tripartite ATP-independent transporter DctP family solute receptor n=1 Tax=Hoeflea marina TaxID=274592 RepID=A0A317PLY2_9HYPH|nr:TRAP transporter substrate-binding protein [Hoeflea marina]PWW00615.1 tripartite ATP-independent transporter DctP family solute receptor [Hoeflea marina]